MTVEQQDETRRREWLAVLARASRESLERAASRWAAPHLPEVVRNAETGMVMLRGRVGGTGDAFNLGEATVTRCALRVGTRLGIGYVLGRDRRKAELVALFDALLQEQPTGDELWRELVQPLAGEQAAARETGSRAAATSRVEFFTMVRGEA